MLRLCPIGRFGLVGLGGKNGSEKVGVDMNFAEWKRCNPAMSHAAIGLDLFLTLSLPLSLSHFCSHFPAQPPHFSLCKCASLHMRCRLSKSSIPSLPYPTLKN